MAKKNTEKKQRRGKKSTKSGFFKRMCAAIAWGTVILLWISASSVFIDPNYFRFLSIAGLIFPFSLAAVVFMFLFCLLFARKLCWIPLLGLVSCALSIRSYCPVNLPSPHPKNCYTFLSYNTMGFASFRNGSESKESKELLQFVIDTKPDFFCFQEGTTNPKQYLQNGVFRKTRDLMPYHDTIHLSNENVIGCCTRFPILKKQHICRNGSNGAGVFLIKINEKDTLHLINCHLKSMGLSTNEREKYHKMVKHLNDSNVESHSRLLISKISKASLIRAEQADSVARYIERHKGKNIVVCGDFNDTPISYTHHRIHSTGLTDAFSATGNGIGRSFNRDAIIVRIDHFFCSEHWKPYGCRIDKSTQASDHYPLVCYLQRVAPEE